jgi:hypothetical protein
MKFLIVFVSSLLMVNGAPQYLVYNTAPILHTAVVSAVPAVSQWHAQDDLGQYSYGYSGGPSAKTEVKTIDGVTSGSYSYVDAENKLQTVNYVADALGFRAAATNLPQAPVDTNEAPKPVEETPEVKQARADHLAAVKNAENDDNSAEVVALEAPKPVEDTVEVKNARAQHLKAVEEAKTRSSSSSDDSETIVAPSTVQIQGPAAIQTIQSVPSPLVYSVGAYPWVHSAQLAHPSVVVKTLEPSKAFSYSVLNAGSIPHTIIAA